MSCSGDDDVEVLARREGGGSRSRTYLRIVPVGKITTWSNVLPFSLPMLIAGWRRVLISLLWRRTRGRWRST
jgi:hypothetical protein